MSRCSLRRPRFYTYWWRFFAYKRFVRLFLLYYLIRPWENSWFLNCWCLFYLLSNYRLCFFRISVCFFWCSDSSFCSSLKFSSRQDWRSWSDLFSFLRRCHLLELVYHLLWIEILNIQYNLINEISSNFI